MSNIIEFIASGGQQGDENCWLCQRATSVRALFCHNCGTIQPVRGLDHFTRMGLERRIDLDNELLERQFAALKRTLDPERFAIRGMGERAHAAAQMKALEEAYETLRDPVRRGRYWLVLHRQEFEEAEDSNPLIIELCNELEAAAEVSQCDRVARKVGQAMEAGIMGLMQLLRNQEWRQANATLMELDGLEVLISSVRARRVELTVPDSDGTRASIFPPHRSEG